MIRNKSFSLNITPRVGRAIFSVVVMGALTNFTAPSTAWSQSVSLQLAPLKEYNALVDDWHKKQSALQAAKKAKQDHAKSVTAIDSDLAAQQSKIEGAKKGLSAAVLKVAEAKKRLSQVDKSDEDPKGEVLSQALIKSQTELNQVIAASETSQAKIEALKSEHQRLRMTINELKKAVSASQAAASAAEVYVDAVRSAQKALADNDTGSESDVQSDFYTDALKQAESAKKSSEVAQKALKATRDRQQLVGASLLEIEELIASAKQAEASAYKKFAASDEAFKAHQTQIQNVRDKQDALIAEIMIELEIASEQLEAQKEILQSETLSMQEFSAIKQTATNQMDDLQSDVDRAQSAFDRVFATLRDEQQTRAIQSAAILADLNSEMALQLRLAAPGSDTSIPTTRLILPAPVLFDKNSAKLRKSDAISMPEVAAIVRDFTKRIPKGVNWMVRVDSFSPGNSDESWFLSQNRALAVAQNLIKNGKFSGAEVSANGLTRAKPLSDLTAGGWVEIVLSPR